MIDVMHDPRAEAKFPATITALSSGEQYPPCPRCQGNKQVLAYTTLRGDFEPPRSEYFACPVCHATGEADAEAAMAFIEQWLETEE